MLHFLIELGGHCFQNIFHWEQFVHHTQLSHLLVWSKMFTIAYDELKVCFFPTI
jgi:hypothetical protein